MPGLYVKNGGAFQHVQGYYVKDGGVWKPVKEAYIKDGGVWKQYYPDFVAGTMINAGLFYTPGPYSWTVPANVFSVTINAIGGGGNCSGWYDSYYTIYVSPGGPAGGIQSLVLSVNPGDVISGNVGAGGGGVGYYVFVGSPGSPTTVTLNGAPVCTADAGGQSTYLGPGGPPGSGSIQMGTGTVVTGTSGYEYATTYGQCGWGYDIWPLINCGTITIPYAGIPPIIAPTAVGANYNEFGRAERSGWVSISY